MSLKDLRNLKSVHCYRAFATPPVNYIHSSLQRALRRDDTPFDRYDCRPFYEVIQVFTPFNVGLTVFLYGNKRIVFLNNVEQSTRGLQMLA